MNGSDDRKSSLPDDTERKDLSDVNDGEDIGTLDLDGDGIPDDLDVDDLDDLVAATPIDLKDEV